MKKNFTFLMLASFAVLSADQYNRNNYDCPSCNTGRGYYQNRSSDNYYNQNNGDNYSQRDGWTDGSNYQTDMRYNANQRNMESNENTSQRNMSNENYSQRNMSNENYSQMNNQSDRRDSRSSDYNMNNDQKTNSDQEIDKKIRDSFSTGWFTKGYEKVNYSINNGNVTLSGTVDSMDKKNKAEETVRKIDGVKQVNNQIVVSENSDKAKSYSDSQESNKYPRDFGATAADRQINAKIRDKLSGWFSNGYDTVILETNNGVVVLTGTVEKNDDVQKINDQLKNVDGVKRLDNRVAVKR